ncbi:hypothetical protein YC2023_009971 [Brassica napus]
MAGVQATKRKLLLGKEKSTQNNLVQRQPEASQMLESQQSLQNPTIVRWITGKYLLKCISVNEKDYVSMLILCLDKVGRDEVTDREYKRNMNWSYHVDVELEKDKPEV